MKMFDKVLAGGVVLFVFGFSGAVVAHAATSPSLGTADGFSILAGTPNITDAGGASAITGDVGLSPATGAGIGLLSSQVTGTIYAVDSAGPSGSVVAPGALTTAKNDLVTAYDALSAGSNATCTDPLYQFGTGVVSLTGANLVPGVYCADAFTLSGTLTLSGSGVWIFRSAATLITSGTANIVGGNACNVWWKVASSATLGTNTSLIGNILALTSITMATGATLNGRALARNGAVTLDHNTITNATCSNGGTLHATLHVVKNVQNDDGDDQHANDFTLYVKLAGTNVAGSPAAGVKSPGKSYSLDAGTYVVSEDEDGAYSQSFSGACNSSGSVTLVAGDNKTCTITNDDKKDKTEVTKKKETVTPKLPAAGVGPQEKNAFWNSVTLVSVLVFVSTSLVAMTRKRTI